MTITTDTTATMTTGATFALDARALSTNLAFIKRTAGMTRRHPQIETLRELRVSVVDGTMTLAYFDYDVMVEVRQLADASDDVAEFHVHFDALATAVKAVGAKGHAVLSLDVAATTLTLEADGMTATAALAPADHIVDAPTLPSITEASSEIVTTGDVLASVGVTTAVARGTDDTLPMLTGVRLESDGRVVEAATTDRFKLAVADLGATNIVEPFGALLAGRPFVEFCKRSAKSDLVTLRLSNVEHKLTADGRQNVDYANHQLAEYRSDDVTIVSRVLDAEFPRFRQLIPGHASASSSMPSITTRFTLDGKSTAARIKSVASGAQNIRIGLALDADGVATVTADGHERFDSEQSRLSTATLAVDDVEHDGEIVVPFAAPYLAAIFAAVPKGERVTVELTNANRPAVFRWRDQLVLLMPVRMAS